MFSERDYDFSPSLRNPKMDWGKSQAEGLQRREKGSSRKKNRDQKEKRILKKHNTTEGIQREKEN